jgi:hypothetical protein
VRATRLIAAAVGLTVCASASVALGAPSSSAPPTIAGTTAYAQKLTCKPGSWSPDAVGFAYAWIDGDVQVATGPTWVATANELNRIVLCRVTATDASGAATTADSAPVKIGQGLTTIKLTTKKSQKKRLVLTGQVGPKGAIAGTAAQRSGYIVADRVGKDGLFQLFGKRSVDKNGKFKVTAPAPFGTHTYEVEFYPADVSLWAPRMKTIKVKLKKK